MDDITIEAESLVKIEETTLLPEDYAFSCLVKREKDMQIDDPQPANIKQEIESDEMPTDDFQFANIKQEIESDEELEPPHRIFLCPIEEEEENDDLSRPSLHDNSWARVEEDQEFSSGENCSGGDIFEEQDKEETECVEEGELAFEDSMCSNDFSEHTPMRAHSNEDKTIVCSICNTKFTKTFLNEHMRSHPGEKSFECSVCSTKLSERSGLSEQNLDYSGEKPFGCSDCSKTFSRQSGLIEHMRIHSSEKPFDCSICNKKFASKYVLNTHKRIHSGEKPFECANCNKTFAYKHSISIHMRTHSGETPFQCSVCNKKFSYKQSFKSHMRTHSGENTFECSICNKVYAQKQSFKVHMSHVHHSPCKL